MKAGPVPGGQVDAEVEASSVVSLQFRIPFQTRAWQKLQENILSIRHEEVRYRMLYLFNTVLWIRIRIRRIQIPIRQYL